MASSSLEYWKRREKEAGANTIKDEKEYNARLNEIYNYTAANIERTVNDWYTRYAKKHNITMAEARARVSKLDMERYEKLAARYVRDREFSAQANEEMEIYNLTMRINRLELLRAQINLELMAGYDDIEKEMERDLIKTAMKEDRRLAGILGNSVIGNEQYAKELVNASFHNATFSERLWGSNMPALRTHLEAELRNGLVQGIHPRELARRFRQHYQGSVYDTERLMITEMRRLQTDVQKESYIRNGFTEYRFITTGDERVCDECENLNGQHFKVSEMQPGENAPPMHPSCRCSTAAYMDSDKYKRWIEALANGEDVRWNDFEEWERDKRFLKSKSDQLNKSNDTDTMTLEDTLLDSINNFTGDSIIDRKALGEEILEEYGVSGVPVNIADIPAFGRCNFEVKDGKLIIKDYNLLKNDPRGIKYQIKTAFHEAYHASGNGRPTDCTILHDILWSDIEETFAETSAIYKLSQYGITGLTPSYPDKLVRMLPRLKQLKEFRNCKTLDDFGKVAYEARLNGGGSTWGDISKRAMRKRFEYSTYVQQYFADIRKDVVGNIDRIVENNPQLSSKREAMFNQLSDAMKHVEDGISLTIYESMLLDNAIALAMDKKGVL